MTQYREIENAAHNLEQLKATYLAGFGWTLTCNTPGSYWLWKRDFADVDAERLRGDEEVNKRNAALGRTHTVESKPYGVVLADTDMAIQMTLRVLDEQPELESEFA